MLSRVSGTKSYDTAHFFNTVLVDVPAHLFSSHTVNASTKLIPKSTFSSLGENQVPFWP